jgi:hypothetical protein
MDLKLYRDLYLQASLHGIESSMSWGKERNVKSCLDVLRSDCAHSRTYHKAGERAPRPRRPEVTNMQNVKELFTLTTLLYFYPDDEFNLMFFLNRNTVKVYLLCRQTNNFFFKDQNYSLLVF